jgi:hypothetical protein
MQALRAVVSAIDKCYVESSGDDKGGEGRAETNLNRDPISGNDASGGDIVEAASGGSKLEVSKCNDNESGARAACSNSGEGAEHNVEGGDIKSSEERGSCDSKVEGGKRGGGDGSSRLGHGRLSNRAMKKPSVPVRRGESWS